MSKRLDDDEHNATAIMHIIEALRGTYSEPAREHLAIAEKHALIVLNRGLDRWHPDYKATTVTPPAEGG